MRILHFISHLNSGGAERVVTTLISEQLRMGHEILLCAGNDGGISYDAGKLGTPLEVLNYRFSNYDVLGKRRAHSQLIEIVTRFRPDVVHSHLWPASRLVQGLARRVSFRHLVHVHDTQPWLTDTDWRSLRDRTVTRYLFNRGRPAARFAAVSSATADATQRSLGIAENRFSTIHNAVDSDLLHRLSQSARETTSKNNHLLVGVAARISEEKGHAVLLEALANLKRDGKKIKGVFAGQTSGYSSKLRDRGNQLLLKEPEDYEFIDHVDDMYAFYDSLDIFALPSISSEGLSIAQLEAMASGLPVVASDVAGASEATRHNVDGIIVRPGCASGLAKAILQLCCDADLRVRMGELGRVRVKQHFNAERLASEVETAYARLVAGRIPI